MQITLIPLGNADKSRFLYNENQLILKKSINIINSALLPLLSEPVPI
jgi:hypothetical protein